MVELNAKVIIFFMFYSCLLMTSKLVKAKKKEIKSVSDKDIGRLMSFSSCSGGSLLKHLSHQWSPVIFGLHHEQSHVIKL